MQSIKLVLLSVIILASISCSSTSFKQSDEAEAKSNAISEYAEQATDASPSEEAGAVEKNKSDILNVVETTKIIKTGNLNIEVENYQTSIVTIRDIIKQSQGYISNEEESHSSYQMYNTLTIRVPKEKFDDLLSKIEKIALSVNSKNVNMQDVSEEYVDLTTRLKTKKEVELRYLDLLKQARSINEILSVENELRVIREEIEAKEGRVKFLDSQVGYSTLTLYVYQQYDNPYEPGFFHKISKALGTGWEGIKMFVIGIFYIWPFWVILGAFFIWLRWFLKKKKNNKK